MQYTMLNYGIVLNNAYTGKKQHIQNFLMQKYRPSMGNMAVPNGEVVRNVITAGSIAEMSIC